MQFSLRKQKQQEAGRMGMDYEEILRVKLFSCEEYTFRKKN